MSDPDIFGIDCGQPLTKFQQLDHLEEGIRGRAELLDKDQQLMMINELRCAWRLAESQWSMINKFPL